MIINNNNLIKKMTALLVSGLMVTGLMTGCAGQTAKDDTSAGKENESITLNVDIAASLNDAMNDIVSAYNEIHPDVTINLNADSSGTLQTQIEEAAGTDIDMFFSAGSSQMDALIDENLIDKETVSDMLKNQVVLIAAKGSDTKVTGFDDIYKASNMALAGESVPVGQYSRQIFEYLGVTDDVNKMEINECADVSAVKNAVAEGSNEVGTVYYSDYYSVKDDVELIAKADESWCDPIVYPVGIVNNPNADDAHLDAVNEFLTYVESDTSKDVFEKYMFIINED